MRASRLDEHADEIKERYLAGEGTYQLGHAFDVNASTVYHWLVRNGVPTRRRWVQILEGKGDVALAAYLAGATMKEVADELGVSYTATRNYLAKRNAIRAYPKSDLTGESFGRLVVIRRADKHESPKGRRGWVCRCDCGVEPVIQSAGALLFGNTRSCGCLYREVIGTQTLSHGCCRRTNVGGVTPEYKTWMGMRTRCGVIGRGDPNYSGRGISVCDRWAYSFASFLEDMGVRPSPQHSIDRINNDGNYEPGNCRWATVAEQSANKRGLRIIEAFGERLHLAEWGRRMGVSPGVIVQRLNRGWGAERAVSTPRRVQNLV